MSNEDIGAVKENLAGEIGQIKKIGEEGLDDLRELGGQIRRRIEDEIKTRPLVAVGVAFGAGALVSTIVTSRVARVAILAAGGYAAREMFGDRLMEVFGREDLDEREGTPRKQRGGEKQQQSSTKSSSH